MALGQTPAGAASAAEALTGATHIINCGYATGRQCQTLTPSLANGVADQALWDPCLGGKFTWTATGSFETNYDRFCVGGVATAGYGGSCTAGSQLNGAGPWSSGAAGAITVSVATDGSVNSGGLTALTATCDEPLMTGVWRAGSAAGQQTLVTGKTWTDFVSSWTTLSGQGKRLVNVETYYDSTGTQRFDGLWNPGTDLHALHVGLTFSGLQTQMDAYTTMNLVDIEAYSTGGGVNYLGVWRQGTKDQKLYDGTMAGFWTWMSPYSAQGYQPTNFEVYFDAAGNKMFTVVITKTPGVTGWTAQVGLDYAKFIRAWRSQAAAGFQLVDLETYLVNGVRTYDGFFLPGAGGFELSGGARLDHLSDLFTQNGNAGLMLVDFDRSKQERMFADPLSQDRQSGTEYPALSPRWMGVFDDYFVNDLGGEAMGYSFAAMKDGKLLGAGGVGYAQGPTDTSPAGGKAMTADTQWDALSISKMFTDIAVIKLTEGPWGLNLDSDIMPYVANKLTGAVGAPSSNGLWNITIRNAIQHMSGLTATNGTCDGGPGTWESYINPSALTGTTGVSHIYSGFNTCMLRLLIEQVSGMTYEAFVDKYLLRPMGIHNVDCVRDPDRVEVYEYSSTPNFYDGSGSFPYRERDFYCTSAGWKITVFDLTRFLQGLRKPGLALSQASLDTVYAINPSFGQPGRTETNPAGTFVGPYATAGARYGARTNAVHFGDPSNHYDSGIDAVFFTNSGGGAIPPLTGLNGWELLYDAAWHYPNP